MEDTNAYVVLLTNTPMGVRPTAKVEDNIKHLRSSGLVGMSELGVKD